MFLALLRPVAVAADVVCPWYSCSVEAFMEALLSAPELAGLRGFGFPELKMVI